MKSVLTNYLHALCNGKNVLVVGLGREGIATCNLLRQTLPGQKIFIADKNITDAKSRIGENADIVFYTGTENDFDITRFDVIFKSPGVPLTEFGLNAVKHTGVITSQTKVFLEVFRNKTVGITGTKGKSTTTTLIYTLLKDAGKKVVLAGNIGVPLFTVFDEGTADNTEYFVLELSSHQLQFLSKSPKYAVLLNFYEEHLDFYTSYTEYQDAKLNIFKYQQPGDTAIYFIDNELLAGRFDAFCQTDNVLRYTFNKALATFDEGCYFDNGVIWFKNSNATEKILDTTQVKHLRGNHNIQNMMAATLVAKTLGVANDSIAHSIIEFKGLPHRMEPVVEFKGIQFFNDSISTIPEAAMYSIETIPNIGTLIAGGIDRGIDYSRFTEFLVFAPIDNIILIDAVGKKLYQALHGKAKANILLVDTLQQAVEQAYRLTPQGKSCVLSPAAASYGMFKNFEERGDKFKEYVLQMGKA